MSRVVASLLTQPGDHKPWGSMDRGSSTKPAAGLKGRKMPLSALGASVKFKLFPRKNMTTSNEQSLAI